MARDLVHDIHRQWQQARPDLDVSSIPVVGRVLRAATLLQRVRDAALADRGLSRIEFDVLAALRRAGPLTPGKLSRETLSSGAATTKRLEHLGQLGLIRRETAEHDRRVAYLHLTDEGVGLIDTLMPEHFAAERAAIAGLTAAQRDQLADLLARLLEHLEGTGSLAGNPATHSP